MRCGPAGKSWPSDKKTLENGKPYHRTPRKPRRPAGRRQRKLLYILVAVAVRPPNTTINQEKSA